MSDHRLSRTAGWLLGHIARENEPLAGDLTEEFALGRSEWWLRRQLLSALLRTSFKKPREIRLRLVDAGIDPGFDTARTTRPRTIDLSGSPVRDIGGLGLAFLLGLMTVVSPQMWWVALTSLLGGIVFGGLLIVRHRHRANAASPSRSLFGQDLPPIP